MVKDVDKIKRFFFLFVHNYKKMKEKSLFSDTGLFPILQQHRIPKYQMLDICKGDFTGKRIESFYGKKLTSGQNISSQLKAASLENI